MALVPTRKRGGELTRLHDEMDDLINSFFRGWEMPVFGISGRWPAIDISEDENQIEVHAEVPGCKAEDIDISVHGNTLTLSGEKKQEQEKKEKGYYHVERSYGSFRRDIMLPSDVDAAKVEATCKNGVLDIKLPKEEKAKARKIQVKGE